MFDRYKTGHCYISSTVPSCFICFNLKSCCLSLPCSAVFEVLGSSSFPASTSRRWSDWIWCWRAPKPSVLTGPTIKAPGSLHVENAENANPKFCGWWCTIINYNYSQLVNSQTSQLVWASKLLQAPVNCQGNKHMLPRSACQSVVCTSQLGTSAGSEQRVFVERQTPVGNDELESVFALKFALVLSAVGLLWAANIRKPQLHASYYCEHAHGAAWCQIKMTRIGT